VTTESALPIPRRWLRTMLAFAALATAGCSGGGATKLDAGSSDVGGDSSGDLMSADRLTAVFGGEAIDYAGSATMARTFVNDGWMLAIVGTRGAVPAGDTVSLTIIRRDGLPIVEGEYICGTAEPEVTLTTSAAAAAMAVPAIACQIAVASIDATAGRITGTFAGMLDAATPISDGVFDLPLAIAAE
jgi:hypothetical protein